MAQLTQTLADLRVQRGQGFADLRLEIALVQVLCQFSTLLAVLGFLTKYVIDVYAK